MKEGDLPRATDISALTEFYVAVIMGMSLSAREGASRKALLTMVETAMRAWPAAPKRAARGKLALAA